MFNKYSYTKAEMSRTVYSLNNNNKQYLHISTDQAVVGSQRRVVKTPVVQIILSGVKVPGGEQMLHVFILKLLKCHLIKRGSSRFYPLFCGIVAM